MLRNNTLALEHKDEEMVALAKQIKLLKGEVTNDGSVMTSDKTLNASLRHKLVAA